ncbi:hypothetical protein AKJ09_11362 [Labilithrix luteola]|uniref:Lipoprotein n=1 Tax=Labilithrix luteola TaxID=1391654 RepID=A0A0K1QG08_9BACT|nr:hypothetical protein [Labilithrix luteola]AKV04699.1 hypothetical protein AKJ09_11362 [Labilithrix luteola]
MAHAGLMRSLSSIARLFAFACTALVSIGCAESPAGPPPASEATAKSAAKVPDYADEAASWGRYHSKRFQLSLPLPSGREWRIDDRSRPNLFAMHEGTSSRLWLTSTQETELMNRQRCEARAKAMGWVPEGLTTVDEEITGSPPGYDSRIWIALDAGKPGGALQGHVFLFGAFLRKCLLVHMTTSVPSAKHEDVLSSRLATFRARVVRGIELDPLRVTDDAEVPRTNR